MNPYIIVAIVVVPLFIGLTMIAGYKIGTTNAVSPGSSPIDLSPLTKWLNIWIRGLILYMPNSIVLFGFIKDAIYEEFRYSIASLIGISSVFVNFLIGLLGQKLVGEQVVEAAKAAIEATSTSPFVPGVPAVTREWNTFGCTVPGFNFLESIFAPQGLVLPASVFTYFLLDLGSNRPPSENYGIGGLFTGLLLLQGLVMMFNGCLGQYYFADRWYGLATWFFGIAVGVAFGSLSYLAVYKIAPEKLPSREGVPSTSNGKPQATREVGNEKGEECSSTPDDGDVELVGELYKDGELITSSIA